MDNIIKVNDCEASCDSSANVLSNIQCTGKEEFKLSGTIFKEKHSDSRKSNDATIIDNAHEVSSKDMVNCKDANIEEIKPLNEDDEDKCEENIQKHLRYHKNSNSQVKDKCYNELKVHITSPRNTQEKTASKLMEEVDYLDSINSNPNSNEICARQAASNSMNESTEEKSPELNKSTSCSQSESIKFALQYPLFEKTHINPSPSEFGMLEEATIPDYSVNLCNKNHISKLDLSQSDNSVVISNNNALPQAENMVSSNYSFAQLRDYGSDESLHDETSTTANYRSKNRTEDSDKDSDTDSSSTSSSTSILVSDSSDSESCNEYDNCTSQVHKPIKGKGELDLDDLPPIEDLKISVPEEECISVGKIYQIVDRLVVIQALKDNPAYDLDTVLFVKGGQPLGKVFDVFGPVAEPYYCVRFNSVDDIKERNITINQIVYCAPKTKYTKYVFLAQLMKLKGSDASWENDEEPPEIFLDYSDDEQEQQAKKKKSRNRKAVFKVDLDPDEPARKKHFAYERRMNERNLQLSAVRNRQYTKNRNLEFNNAFWDTDRTPAGPSTSNTKLPVPKDNCHQMFGRPPVFNTRVPPPNFSFPVPFRPNMLNIHIPNRVHTSNNIIQTPRPSFIIPNGAQTLPHPTISPVLSTNPETQAYSFSPTQLPGTLTLVRNREPNNSNPNWFKTYPNSWTCSPPHPHPAREMPSTSNTMLPSSPFWIQRPPPSPNSSIQRTISALPNRPYLPPCPPPPPPCFWPVQTPHTPNGPLSNTAQVNFNPHIPPPPSPNPFNY